VADVPSKSKPNAGKIFLAKRGSSGANNANYLNTSLILILYQIYIVFYFKKKKKKNSIFYQRSILTNFTIFIDSQLFEHVLRILYNCGTKGK